MRERVRPGRRAIVVFVPAAARAPIDEIRMRWDPVMCARIGPHITLIHDVVEGAPASDLVAAAAASIVPFPVRLTDTAHWGESAYGVYLHVEDPSGGLMSLHAQLAELEDPRWARVRFRAHVTLVHSRTTEPEVAARAWAALDEFHAGWEHDVEAIDIVELGAAGWHTVERHELAPC